MSNWVSGLRRIARAATILSAALMFTLATAHAQSFNVTNLTSDKASKASYPTMVIDAKGNINLAWIDSASGIMFARSTDGGKTFAKQTVSTVVPSFQPQMVVYQSDTNIIDIVWAAPHPSSPPTTPPTYDVFASRSDDGGTTKFFTTADAISASVSPTGVPLFDSPRVAIDGRGTTDVVWGQNNVWISQAQDGKTFGTPISLIKVATPPSPPIPPPNTGGPRIAVTAASHIFVVWTDEASKNAPGSFCTAVTKDTNGKVTNTLGGNVWINETIPNTDPTLPPVKPNPANTRNLSITDWTLPNTNPEFSLDLGFYGCSYDNMSLFLDKPGLLHLLWSDDSPGEDVLTSETHGTYPPESPFAGLTEFSFPGNLASLSAASPQVAVDKNGIFYFTWSGGPNGGPNSEGIFYIRSDDAGSSFTSCAPGPTLCGAINVAPKGAVSPAFPQIAVDSKSNVNIAWEQPTAALKGDGTDLFNVFFARSTDKQTFPTVLPVTTAPSTLCYEAPPFPEGTTPPTALFTPDVTTCGTVQLGVDANSTPDMVWVNQASGSAVADIDFATTAFPTGSLSSNAVSLSPTTTTAAVTITVSQNGFSGPVTFSCFDVDTNSSTLPSWLTCTFNPPTLSTAQSTTDTLTFTRTGTPTTSMFVSGPSSHILPDFGRPMALSIGFAAFGLMAMTMLAVGRRQKLSTAVVMRGFLVVTLTLALGAALVSCGGSTSSPSTTSTTGTSGSSGSTGSTGGTGSGGTGGSGGSGGSGGTGGTGGGTIVTVHVAVIAQSSGAAAVNLGTVAVTAQ